MESELNDMELAAFMKKEAIKQKRLAEVEKKKAEMANDLRMMTKEAFKLKYVNPSKAWAELRFEEFLAKRGITREEYFGQLRQSRK